MSAGLQITGFGFDELKTKLDSMGEDIQKEAGRLIKDGAQRIAQAAKGNAPVDFGILKNLIYAEPEGDYGANVHADANYSGYVEWGTGNRVNIAIEPTERDYEETFKTGRDTVGHYAQPFFFPAVYEILPSIIDDVNTMLQEEANK